MTKVFFALVLIACFGGVVASIAESANPGSMMYDFKTHVNDPIAQYMCDIKLPCRN